MLATFGFSFRFGLGINVQRYVHHPDHTLNKGIGVFQRVSRMQDCALMKQRNPVLGGRIGLACANGLDQRVRRNDLQDAVVFHVIEHVVVLQRLSTHDAFHVGRVAILSGDQNGRHVQCALAHAHRLHLLLPKCLMDVSAELGVLRDSRIAQCLFELGGFFGDINQLLAIVFTQTLEHILVHAVHEEQSFPTLGLERCQER